MKVTLSEEARDWIRTRGGGAAVDLVACGS